MINFKTELKRNNCTTCCINKIGVISIIQSDLIYITMTRKNAEKVFNVNLQNREYYICADEKNVEITFNDKNNCCGWVERISLYQFLFRCSSK